MARESDQLFGICGGRSIGSCSAVVVVVIDNHLLILQVTSTY